MTRARRGSLLLLVAALLLSGCTSGSDATVYGGTFTFTSPGGKFEFDYPAADRKTIGELSGPDLAGTSTISLSDYRGKVVVLNFWGSWCAACRDEAAGLQLAWQRYQGRPVQFIGVDVKDPAADALAFTAAKQITYPSIFDFGMRTMISVRGLPTETLPLTMVLDEQGRVAHIWLTEVTGGDLNGVIPQLLGSA